LRRGVARACHAVFDHISFGSYGCACHAWPLAFHQRDLAGTVHGNRRGDFRKCRPGDVGDRRSDAGSAIARDVVWRECTRASASNNAYARPSLYQSARGRIDGLAFALVGQRHGRLAADRRLGGSDDSVFRRRVCSLPASGGTGIVLVGEPATLGELSGWRFSFQARKQQCGRAEAPRRRTGAGLYSLTTPRARISVWILLLGSSGALLWIRRTIQVLRLGVFLAGGHARVLAVERAACGCIDAERGIADRLRALHAAPATGRRAGLSHRALRLGK